MSLYGVCIVRHILHDCYIICTRKRRAKLRHSVPQEGGCVGGPAPQNCVRVCLSRQNLVDHSSSGIPIYSIMLDGRDGRGGAPPPGTGGPPSCGRRGQGRAGARLTKTMYIIRFHKNYVIKTGGNPERTDPHLRRSNDVVTLDESELLKERYRERLLRHE